MITIVMAAIYFAIQPTNLFTMTHSLTAAGFLQP